MMMTGLGYVKKYWRSGLGFVILLLGGTLFFLGYNNFMIRSTGLLISGISIYLIRPPRKPALETARIANKQNLQFMASNRPTRVAWLLGLASAVALGIFYFFMNQDAIEGHHHIWPVYGFVGVGLICACVWGYIVTKLRQ